MKKFLFIAAAALAMVSCSKDSEVIPTVENGKQNAIGFQVTKQNMGRATNMQNTHINFGAWAYKVNSTTDNQQVFDNYLVGYFGSGSGYKKLTPTTDEGLNHNTGTSEWGYEGLGSSEYTYTTNDGYVKSTDTEFMSNKTTQFLKYWDKSYSYTMFYAYAPYINGANTATFDFDATSGHTLTFPNGTIEDGYDIDPQAKEYLYAATRVDWTNYGNKVSMEFKRLNAKVRIAFYEEVPGYNVTINNLTDTYQFISAAPAKPKDGGNYEYCDKLYKTAGATIRFASVDATTANVTMNHVTPYANTEYLKFNVPSGGGFIKEVNSGLFSDPNCYSQTEYYAIPKGDECGLTFHVSFTLTAQDTHETIFVRDATVHVPGDKCKWDNNKQYSYIFKITKNVSGSTDPHHAANPASPEVNKKALYPIVFDGLTIEDWVEPAVDTETPIN